MKLRTDWQSYLRTLRKHEIEIIFGKCPRKLFKVGLELGAGDGFQSQILADYVVALTSTDYSPIILENRSGGSIEYRVCDAEALEEEFGESQFDLVFSSNLLEHLPNPQKALRGISRVLKPDGLGIHIVPSPFWKLTHLLLYVPNLGAGVVEVLMGGDGVNKVRAKLKNFNKCLNDDIEQPRLGNNPKIVRSPRSTARKLIMPEPHGVSQYNIGEFYAFSRFRWMKEFAAANFKILRILKGPVTSGYGFGLNGIRKILERCGYASEYIYITAKNGSSHDYKRYF